MRIMSGTNYIADVCHTFPFLIVGIIHILYYYILYISYIAGHLVREQRHVERLTTTERSHTRERGEK